MSERLRLTVQQAIDAEETFENFASSTTFKSEACTQARQVVAEVHAHILAVLSEAPELILDEGGRGITLLQTRIHAMLTELGTPSEDDFPLAKGDSA